MKQESILLDGSGAEHDRPGLMHFVNNQAVKVEITNHQIYNKCVHSLDYDLTWINGIVEGRMTIIDTEGVDHHYEGIFTPTEFYKWGIKLTNDNCDHPWDKTESTWGGGTLCQKCMKTI